MDITFESRTEAGTRLAELLIEYEKKNVIVYALPRGGVPVGFEIAERLKAPLELFFVRKIGHPMNPEYAIGAVAEDGTFLGDEEELEDIEGKWLKAKINEEKEEIERRRKTYGKSGERQSAYNKIAILVDDGVATGFTMKLAADVLQDERPTKLVIAVPVISEETYWKLKTEVSPKPEIVAIAIDPNFLGAVGAYYHDFPQLTDEEVFALLKPGV